jgi:hypothetical protein
MDETRSDQNLELQLEKWKKLLLVYSGAAGMLLATTMADLPQAEAYFNHMGRVMTIGPWFGIWLVLFLGCLTPGIILITGRPWRNIALTRRQPVAFGFLACAWTALLALDLRILPLESPVLFHALVLVLGLLLGSIYLVLQRRIEEPEEMFP